MKLNETDKLLTYANDVNLLGDNIDAIKKNTYKGGQSRNKCREN
jgi:hypothetical protein